MDVSIGIKSPFLDISNRFLDLLVRYFKLLSIVRDYTFYHDKLRKIKTKVTVKSPS